MVAAMTKLLSFRINTFDLTCISWNGKIFQLVCFWVLDFQCGAEKVSSPNPSVEKMFLSLPEIMLMQHFEHLNRISWFTSVGGFNEISWEFSMKLPLLWFYIALGTNNKHLGPTWGWVPWASDPATRTWRGWVPSGWWMFPKKYQVKMQWHLLLHSFEKPFHVFSFKVQISMSASAFGSFGVKFSLLSRNVPATHIAWSTFFFCFLWCFLKIARQ